MSFKKYWDNKPKVKSVRPKPKPKKKKSKK